MFWNYSSHDTRKCSVAKFRSSNLFNYLSLFHLSTTTLWHSSHLETTGSTVWGVDHEFCSVWSIPHLSQQQPCQMNMIRSKYHNMVKLLPEFKGSIKGALLRVSFTDRQTALSENTLFWWVYWQENFKRLTNSKTILPMSCLRENKMQNHGTVLKVQFGSAPEVQTRKHQLSRRQQFQAVYTCSWYSQHHLSALQLLRCPAQRHSSTHCSHDHTDDVDETIWLNVSTLHVQCSNQINFITSVSDCITLYYCKVNILTVASTN